MQRNDRTGGAAVLLVCTLLLAFGLVLAACGDGGQAASPAATIYPSASGAPASPAPSTLTPSPAEGKTPGASPTPGATATPTPGATPVARSDAAIRAGILEKYARDPALRTLDIRVVVRSGVVYLKGQVPSQKLRQRAERIAVSEPGVRKVVSYLVVTTTQGY